MANLFKAVEIIDMGIEKEKKRRDFYALAAERFEDKKVRALFEKLRDWEGEHIKKFTDIRNSIKDTEATDSYPGELMDYINAIVDNRLYKSLSPASFSEEVKDVISAVEYGIAFEKDAILFFRELAAASLPAHKAVIEQLIGEEKKHILYLTELKRGLS
jgi:rubrerythrin